MSTEFVCQTPEKFAWVENNLNDSKNQNLKAKYSKMDSFFENFIVTQNENKIKQNKVIPKAHGGSQSPSINSTCNSFEPSKFMKYRNNRNCYIEQLPIIEEEGSLSEKSSDTDYEFTNYKAKDEFVKRKSCDYITSIDIKKETRSELLDKKYKPPPENQLININCLLNPYLKQSQQIWHTGFGRKLIGANNEKNNIDSKDLFPLSRNQNSKHNCKNKDGNISSNKNLPLDFNTKFKKGKINCELKPTSKKLNKTRNFKKNSQKISKDCTQSKNVKYNYSIPSVMNPRVIDYDTLNTDIKKEENYIKEKISATKVLQENVHDKYEVHNNDDFLVSSSPSYSEFQNQHFLTKCVADILEKPEEFACEFCPGSYPNFNNLLEHKKKHEDEAQSCLICKKIYYKKDEFALHLVTHESVDKFGCQKCKKYFPTLKKLIEHNKKIHFIDWESCEMYQNSEKNDIDNFNQNHSKFECVRCKKLLGSEENLRAHKRLHLKMDLTAAHLLCCYNINA